MYLAQRWNGSRLIAEDTFCDRDTAERWASEAGAGVTGRVANEDWSIVTIFEGGICTRRGTFAETVRVTMVRP